MLGFSSSSLGEASSKLQPEPADAFTVDDILPARYHGCAPENVVARPGHEMSHEMKPSPESHRYHLAMPSCRVNSRVGSRGKLVTVFAAPGRGVSGDVQAAIAAGRAKSRDMAILEVAVGEQVPIRVSTKAAVRKKMPRPHSQVLAVNAFRRAGVALLTRSRKRRATPNLSAHSMSSKDLEHSVWRGTPMPVTGRRHIWRGESVKHGKWQHQNKPACS